MKLKEINKSAAQIISRYGFGIDCVNEDAKAITKLLIDLQRLADDGIAAGETRGKIPVQWQHNGKFVGMANFAMSTILVQDDVGVVIVSFSGFASCIVDLRRILKVSAKKGWKTLADVERFGTYIAKARANSVRMFLETFQGMYDDSITEKAAPTVMAYTLEYKADELPVKDGEKVGGYEIETITPIKASEIVYSINNMIIEETPIADLLKACEDMAGSVRQAGESTIDTRKKPVLIVIAGIPGLETLKRDVKYMSRENIELKICWAREGVKNELGVVAKFGDVRVLLNGRDVVKTRLDGDKEVLVKDDFDGAINAYFDDEKLGGIDSCNSWQEPIIREDKIVNRVLHICDVAHMARMALFRQATAFLEEQVANRYSVDDNIQNLWEIPKEKERIAAAVKRFNFSPNGSDVGLITAIRDLGQKYLSCMNASINEIDDIETVNRLYKVDKNTTITLVKKAKEDRSVILESFANEARLIFEAAEKTIGKIIPAADRVRLIWHVVIENARDKETKKVAWERLGNLAQNLLDPEYMLWTLDTFSKENVGEIAELVPKVVRFAVQPFGVFADATAEELLQFDGLEVAFAKGEAIDEGEVFLVGKTDCSGKFKIVAEEIDGNIKLWATKTIKEMVVVPDPQFDKRVVKLVSNCGISEMEEIAKATMDATEIYILRDKHFGDGFRIGTCDGGDVVTLLNNALVNLPNSVAGLKAFNIDYRNENKLGVKGTVTFYKTFQYDTNEKGETETKASGFLVLENVMPVTASIMIEKTVVQ